MITLKSCPNCESRSIAQYKVLDDGDLIVETIPGVRLKAVIVVRFCICRNCSLIFQNPRLSDKELDIYYSSGYYRKTINPPPEGMEKGESDRAKTDAEIIKRHIGKVISHLDIGCGIGYLLDEVGAARKVGVESDVNYVDVKGIKVYSSMGKVLQKKFDLVTSVHTLEHVPHPLDYLKSMVKFVGNGGYLVVEVPSWKTRGGPLGFAHLFHFEPDVLKLMCKQVGLEVIHTEFTPHSMLICKADHS